MKPFLSNFASLGWICVLIMLYSVSQGDNRFLWSYFHLSLYEVLNLLFVGFFVYFYTEQRNQCRSRQIFLKQIIDRIIARIEHKTAYYIECEDDVKRIILLQRTIQNELELLKKYQDEFGYENQLEKCNKYFRNYWEIVSENQTNISLLMSLKNQNKRLNELTKLVNGLERLLFELYE